MYRVVHKPCGHLGGEGGCPIQIRCMSALISKHRLRTLTAIYHNGSQTEIAIFFGNILREERNSVFPHFSPKKSVFSGHEWLQFECRAKRDILNRSHEWPEYTDFAGGKAGENWISLFDYNMNKEGYFPLSYKPFEYYFELFELLWRCLEKSSR